MVEKNNDYYKLKYELAKADKNNWKSKYRVLKESVEQKFDVKVLSNLYPRQRFVFKKL